MQLFKEVSSVEACGRANRLNVLEMAPKETSPSFLPSGVLSEVEAETVDGGLKKVADQEAEKRKFQIVWRNVVIMSTLHVFFFCGLWALVSGRSKWQTNMLGKDFQT
jgi:hypothetical protein